ncbi:MAG TPA: hypothetical protein DIW41_07995 [Lachnospiraceae bacterium]|nr:hypothetical protein [Lachnospiraceae bacterium]
MYFETLKTMAEVFAAYFLIIILLTAFMLKPFVKNKTASEKFLTYIVIGNVYVINVVYLLAYLGSLKQIPFIFLLVGGALIIRVYFDRHQLKANCRLLHQKFDALLAGEYGNRLFLRNIQKNLFKKISILWNDLIGRNILERLFFLGIMGYLIYLYSYQTLHYASFAAPDEEVHLYWIQSLIAGDIFPSGIYPHGFHNICSALIVIFQFKAVSVIRVISVTSTVLIMTMLYILLKRICRSPYIAIVAFGVFALFDIYSSHATARYQFSVPQEYAMIFLYPMAIFLIEYLRKERKEDLILFGLSFSLTLMIHFYVTIIAGILCVAIEIGYLHRVFIFRNLKKLFLSAFLALFMALVPFLVAFMMGHELEQSMSWALSIIKTGNNDMKNIISDPSKEDNEELKDDKGEETFYQRLEHEVTKYMVNSMKLFYAFIGLLLLTIIFSLCRCLLKREKEQTRYQLIFGIYGCFLVFLILCRPFGLPTIMEAKRAGIFFAYMSALLIAMPLEVIYELTEKSMLAKKLIPTLFLGGMVVSIPFMYKKGYLHTNDYFYYIQTKGAMIAINRILDEYEDFKWTVISPVNELGITLNNGYHYELIDFLLDQEDWNEDMILRIPTKYVFLFVEKRPISRYGTEVLPGDDELKHRAFVSMEDANKDLIRYEASKSNYNYIYQRDIVMSKAYYWAKQYIKYFPREMHVFYEDDEIVIYKIDQNEYALNNFAIDYGFNSK